MTNTARDTILANLKQNSPAKTYDVSDFSVLKEKQYDQDTKIQTYKTVTQAVNTEVHDLKGKGWKFELQNILNDKGVRHLMYGPNTNLAIELETDWTNKTTQLQPYDDAMESCKEMLFDVDAAITTSYGAIAETGSLILWPTKEEPRLLSLTPPIHIAIVHADQFYSTLYEAMEVNKWSSKMPTNLLLISGPSKTADIEQELCYGVHGPKELIVLIRHD